MSHKGLYQTGLIFAILTTLGWVIFIAGLVGGTPSSGAGPVADYLADAESRSSLLYLWGGVLGSLAVVPVYVAMTVGHWRDTGSVLFAPVALAIVGVVLLTLGFAVDVGSAVYYHAPTITDAA
jgi:hypothetical protein